MEFEREVAFEAAMKAAGEYLTFLPYRMDPDLPQGVWFMDSITELAAVEVNAVVLGIGMEWNDVVYCRKFLASFKYMVIVAANGISRDEMVKQLRPRLPGLCIYVLQDSSFRGCASVVEFVKLHGKESLLELLEGAEELPAYGLIDLTTVESKDMSKVPRTLSRFKVLDGGIGGFFGGELSLWTGKRGIGKSTILSQILLEAVDQGHVVCAYSGELDRDQFRDWTYLQAAGPKHIAYMTDQLTGKKMARANSIADRQISEWMKERFWLFDLEVNTRHDPQNILSQFEYAKMRYGADVFLVDNIMTVDFRDSRDKDFYRAQSDFGLQLAAFAKRHQVHIHLVVHPKKDTSDEFSKLSADDVGGSGDLTNAASNVFFLATHMAEDKKGGKLVEKPILKILKNRRYGAKGSQWLDFDKKSRRYFMDRTGDPERPYGWDPCAQQIQMQEVVELPPGEAKDLPF